MPTQQNDRRQGGQSGQQRQGGRQSDQPRPKQGERRDDESERGGQDR